MQEVNDVLWRYLLQQKGIVFVIFLRKWPSREMDLSFALCSIYSLRPTDAIWRHRSGSTLAQVIAWWHQAITWTNVNLSSVRSSGIHLRAISWEIPQPLFTKVGLKITYLKLIWNLPGANDLRLNSGSVTVDFIAVFKKILLLKKFLPAVFLCDYKIM